jgi:hypothetical protein
VKPLTTQGVKCFLQNTNHRLPVSTEMEDSVHSPGSSEPAVSGPVNQTGNPDAEIWENAGGVQGQWE